MTSGEHWTIYIFVYLSAGLAGASVQNHFSDTWGVGPHHHMQQRAYEQVVE